MTSSRAIDPEWERRYQLALASPRWRWLRKKLDREQGGTCSRCHVAFRRLQLHHLTYVRLGRELLEDVELICEACHKMADREREVRTYTRSWDNRLDGWAAKKYGEDWADYKDADAVREEFYEWVDKQSE